MLITFQEKIIPCLLYIKQNPAFKENEQLQCQVKMALALIGHANPVGGSGIRILSIDGGGTRCEIKIRFFYLYIM